MLALGALQLLLFLLSWSTAWLSPPPKRDITRSWGAYSPFFSVDSEPYRPPPRGCLVDQVHILERHGARFPTLGAGARIISAVDKLQSVSTYTDPRLEFLKTFEYPLGVADLVPFGALQSRKSGEIAYSRYSHLVTKDLPPFVRSSGGQRVVDSAWNWTAGFATASRGTLTPTISVIFPENPEFNNTLDDHNCPNSGTSTAQTSTWLSIFAPPITQRLNLAAPGAGLSDGDTYALMSLCAFHSVATARGSALSLSPFCELFSDDEFEDFEYAMDLDKYYGTGPGAHLGRVQGVGYTTELLARLTSSHTSLSSPDPGRRTNTNINTTLDGDPRTFPLNRTLYADFSHDNLMVAVYAAIGLVPQEGPLDPTRRPSGGGKERTWIASHLVPFGARMVVERLRCSSSLFPSYDDNDESTAAVRILINDAVQPLPFCSRSGAHYGVCELDAFVESQSYARNGGEGDWEECFD